MPPEATVNVPAPVTALVPQLSVPFTVKVRPLATGRLLLSVVDALPAEGIAQLRLAPTMVPADCVNVFPAPFRLIVITPARLSNVLPVWFQLPPRFMVIVPLPLLDQLNVPAWRFRLPPIVTTGEAVLPMLRMPDAPVLMMVADRRRW